MRVLLLSVRMVWADLVQGFRRCRKVWGFALLWLALGITLGVILAVMVAEPAVHSVLGDVLAHTYRPFGVWGLCAACVLAGITLCYLSARSRYRPLVWLYVFAVGYVLGRLVTFACMGGVVGIVSILLCEIPFAILSLLFVIGYYCDLLDTLLTTLRPACNKVVVLRGVRMAAWGAVATFLPIVAVWGAVQAIVNIVV